MGSRGLIGRGRELGLLDEEVVRVLGGGRSTVLVMGEPGIGKTRLLEVAEERVAEAGGLVAWGRTWEVGLTPSFWPWIQVLESLAGANADVPDLRSFDDQRADAATRLARFDEVARFIARQASERPLALLLDDLHAADPSSLQLLEFVARHAKKGRVLIVGSARDADGTASTQATLGRIQRDARRIDVARLDHDAVAVLVGRRASAALRTRVFELSEGNPLFVEELVASLASGSLRLPAVSGVRVLIRERVARLPPETHRLLLVAALLGRDFRGVIAATVAELAPVVLAARLEPALRAGLVMSVGPDRYRFSHAVVAEALSDELEPTDKALLHLAAAQAIEHHEGDSGAHAHAHHLLAAGHLAAGAAVQSAAKAAAAAMRQLAFEDAAMLLERALALVAPDEPQLRVDLLVQRAEALQHAGQHVAGRATCDEAMALATRLGVPERMADAALARGLEFSYGRTDQSLVAMIGAALAAQPAGDSPRRARLLARLAAAEQPAQDPRPPIARAHEAIAMARRLGEPRTLLEVIHVAFAALIEYDSASALSGLVHELLALVGPSEPLIALRAQLRRAFIAIECHDWPGARAAIAAHAGLHDKVGVTRLGWHVHLLDALVSLTGGRFEDARRAADEAEANLLEHANEQGVLPLWIHRAVAAWTRTTPLPTPPDIRTSYPLAYVPCALWVAVSHGDVGTTRTFLGELLPNLHDDFGLVAASAGAIALRDRASAAVLYPLVVQHAGELELFTMMGFGVLDFYDRLLVGLAALTNRWDPMDSHARSALALAEKLAARPWIARIKADWADALDLRQRGDDRAQARALRAEALAEALVLDMPGLIARCAAPAADPTPAARSSSTLTIVAEGGLWLVRGAGGEARIKDGRGVQMLARLVAEPGRELHVLDLNLMGAEGADDGDAGELLDQRAREAYRTRITDLREDLAEAEAHHDSGRAERAQAELERLTAELARGFGLGGRERRAGQAAERARSNVQRRVSHAIQQIRAASPPLGALLAKTIRTGLFCAYEPDA